MTPRHLASLICKGLGIFFVVTALGLLGSAFAVIFGTTLNAAFPGFDRTILFSNLVRPIIQLMAGVVLWTQADTLSHLMASDDVAPAPSSISARQAQMLIFSGLGVWTLLNAAPDVVLVISKVLFFNRQDPMMRPDMRGMSAPEILALLTQNGLGGALLFGAARMANAFGTFESGSTNGGAMELKE